jgi:hypothetical protein
MRDDIACHMPILKSVAGRNEAIDRFYNEKGRAMVAEAETKERLEIKQFVTQGRSVFTFTTNNVKKQYDSESGHLIEYSRDGRPVPPPNNWWLSAPLETLRAVRAQVEAERGFRGKSADQLREEIRPNVPRNQVGGDFKATLSKSDGTSSSTQSTDDVEVITLCHPESGEVFTRASVISYLNKGNSSENARKLLVRGGRIHRPSEVALLRLLGKIK